MTLYVERYFKSSPNKIIDNRLQIKAFPRDAGYKFLATGDNALHWKESGKGLKAGTYAYAGGQWHNVKNLDPSILPHI